MIDDAFVFHPVQRKKRMAETAHSSHYKTITPHQFDLPQRIHRLGELAYNLWWTWKPEAMRLFVTIDRNLWERTSHNPIRFLFLVERARLNEMIRDHFFLDEYDRVFEEYDRYMTTSDTWFTNTYPNLSAKTIAYFSMEFGLHETLALYAGGLGVLSGDHLKEASDLGLPMVAVGFLYTRGYFAQRITEDGWQETRDYQMNVSESPLMPVVDQNQNRILINLQVANRPVQLQIWQVCVGRIKLFLLDSDIEVNSFADRQLTTKLYSGDPDLRIQQEILLGIGGVRALRELGYAPAVWHMNEGHSAFLALERIRELVTSGIPITAAIPKIRATNVFTTHTPVPAGNDEFPAYLIEKYFYQYWHELGLDRDQFLQLASCQRTWGEAFSMPVLAMKLSEFNNAVSELHGQVTRQMWHFLWPELPVDQVPIGYITNGIHTRTWMARRLRNLFDRYLSQNWMDHLDEQQIWDQILAIPDEELWAVRLHLKRKLVYYIKEKAREFWMRGAFHPVQVIAGGVLLDPYALTIGFARRFAPYKRANLVLRDVERLTRLLNRPNMPVQIVFAGKSHPDNEAGKLLIQEVYRAAKKGESGGRLVFLEDYDMNLARYLVQGVDVWLNTPRRPMEASGTSGQKAALNGALNFSVLDGWWREGFNGHNGWAIGEDADSGDDEAQDRRDAQDFYEILETEIIPLYYQERTPNGLPREWVHRMKESIRTLAPMFSTRRMVKEYTDRMYLPGLQFSDEREA
jgi:glycogen phosphorylase